MSKRAIPASIQYVWTQVDNDRASAVSRHAGAGEESYVTPYKVFPWNLPDAKTYAVDKALPLPLASVTDQRAYVRLFIPEGYTWKLVPYGVKGATIRELLAALLKHSPDMFPPELYDVDRKDHKPSGGLPIEKILFEFWGNTAYRAACSKANGGKPEKEKKNDWKYLLGLPTKVGDEELELVLAKAPLKGKRAVAPVEKPGDKPPQPLQAGPQLVLPKMQVGVNYPWGRSAYGLNFGPKVSLDWLKELPATLSKFQTAGVSFVRFFVLANAWGYGDPPTKDDSGAWVFDPPSKSDDAYAVQLREFLEAFKRAEMQVIPSLIDFKAFSSYYGDFGGGGRMSLVLDEAKRTRFFDTMLAELLKASRDYRPQIFAWEVMNEPVWNTKTFSPPVGWDSQGDSSLFSRYAPVSKVVPEATMSAFLAEGVRRIEAEGFRSTVGHRYYDDLAKFPKGNRPQYHFYARTIVDPDEIAAVDSIKDEKEKPFLGEFSASDGSEGGSWKELQPWQQQSVTEKMFYRLRAAARKGYDFASPWPDIGGDPSMKFSKEALEGIAWFRRSRSWTGIP